MSYTVKEIFEPLQELAGRRLLPVRRLQPLVWARERSRLYRLHFEPLLQVDVDLVDALHGRHFSIDVETNGTQQSPAGIDWVCLSPKADAAFAITSGNELKLVYPQAKATPESFTHLAFDHFFLQPMDAPETNANLSDAIAYCTASTPWRLSLQSHKMIGIR